MKQASKKQIKRRSTQLIAIILGALMVVGAIITLIVTLLPSPKLEKYVDKKLRLVSVVCEWTSPNSTMTAQDKARILEDLRQKSGKKNATEAELLEWYAKGIKKDLKKPKLKFTSDTTTGGYYIATKGDNVYRYEISYTSSGSYNYFTLSGANVFLNGTYRIDSAHGKFMHTATVDYTYALNGEEKTVKNAFTLEFFYN